MLLKRLFFVTLLTHIVYLCKSRTIQNQILKINSTPTTDLHANGIHRHRAIDLKRLTSKTVNDGTLQGGSGERKPKTTGNNRCPYETKQLCLIFSLSKIANVHVTDQTDQSLKSSVLPSAWNDDVGVDEKLEGNEDHYGRGNFAGSSKKDLKSPNVHCRAIRDVYIPDAKQKLPAFACKFHNKTFVLSSTRFFQDRRPYLDINLNDDVFKNVKQVRKISRSNDLSVIPALLVLNVPNNDYRIERRDSVSDERKVNPDERNR
ncbi:uncharacterized protein LOC143221873 isoform X1 [Lasioglossum baleicum]|uniref:uncharacterized protein LOC143221873 isoform X1 n=1 Tax=Lasioglossum baleicum TaxID=434251 RepID=UPI003FCC6D07